MPQFYSCDRDVKVATRTEDRCGPYRPIDDKHKLGIWPPTICTKTPADWARLKLLGYSLVLVDDWGSDPQDYWHHLDNAHSGGWSNSETLLSGVKLLDDLYHSTQENRLFTDDIKKLAEQTVQNGNFYGIWLDEPTTRYKEAWDAVGEIYIMALHGDFKESPLKPQNVIVDHNRDKDFDKLVPNVDRIIVDDWDFKSTASPLYIAPLWFKAFAESFDGKGSRYPVSINGWLNIANNYFVNRDGVLQDDQYNHITEMFRDSRIFFDSLVSYGNGDPTLWIYPGDICQEILLKILQHLDGIPHKENFSWYFASLVWPVNGSEYQRLGYYNIIQPIIDDPGVTIKKDLSDLDPVLQDFLRNATKEQLRQVFLGCWSGAVNPSWPCGGQCAPDGIAQDLFCSVYCNRLLDTAKKAAAAGWLRQDCLRYETDYFATYHCKNHPCTPATCPWNEINYASDPNWFTDGNLTRKDGPVTPTNNLPDPVYSPTVEPCKNPFHKIYDPRKDYPTLRSSINPEKSLPVSKVDDSIINSFIDRHFIFEA